MTTAGRRFVGALALGTFLAGLPVTGGFDPGGLEIGFSKAFAKDGRDDKGGDDRGGGSSGSGKGGGGKSSSSSGKGGSGRGGGDDNGDRGGSGRGGGGDRGGDDRRPWWGRGGGDDARGGDDNGGRGRGGDGSGGDDDGGRRGGDDRGGRGTPCGRARAAARSRSSRSSGRRSGSNHLLERRQGGDRERALRAEGRGRAHGDRAGGDRARRRAARRQRPEVADRGSDRLRSAAGRGVGRRDRGQLPHRLEGGARRRALRAQGPQQQHGHRTAATSADVRRLRALAAR